MSLDKVHPTQHGVYDPGILCADCDGRLGKGDDYALEVCRRFARDHKTIRGGLFEMHNVDGDRFATFVLSVLWRASISSRVECRSVSLGPYESEACEVIFGAKPLHAMTAYQLSPARCLTGNAIPGFSLPMSDCRVALTRGSLPTQRVNLFPAVGSWQNRRIRANAMT